MANIIKDSLVGYWHYAQGVSGTTWQNIAPNYIGKYNGTINGATLQSDGMYFNGTSNFVSIGEVITELVNTYNFTVEILFNKPVTTSTTTTLFSQNDASTKSHHIKSYYASAYSKTIPQSLYVNTVGPINDNLYGGNNEFDSTNNLITVTNVYGNRKLYLNGILVGTSTTAINMALKKMTFGALIGTSGTISNYFKGIIKAVRIYNKTLTDAEVQQNYTIGAEIGFVDSTIFNVNFDTLQNFYLRYDLKQSLYLPVSFNYDILQHFVDTVPQINVDVQDAIKIYKYIDNSLVSTQGIMDNPIQFSLDINKNEVKEQRLYINCKDGYTLSDVIISFVGDSSNRWQLALDVNGNPNTYLDPLTSLDIGTVGGVAGQNVYFWVKASVVDTEELGNDNSVILNVTGKASIY
jgi:hypothetical protein